MKETSRLERFIVIFAALLLCTAVYSVLNIEKFLLESARSQVEDEIGAISHSSNDVRHRDSSQVNWSRARRKNKIFWNDSLFTGEGSEAKVNLKNGTVIQLKSNSLVRFRKRSNMKLMELSGGLFELEVHGSTELSIGGRRTKLSGRGARIKLMVDKKTGHSQLKVISGKVTVSDKDGRRSLAQGQGLNNRIQALVAPQFLNEKQKLKYVYKFYDQYKMKDQQWVRKENDNIKIKKNIRLSWLASSQAQSYELKLLKWGQENSPVLRNENLDYHEILHKITVKTQSDLSLKSGGRYRAQVRALSEQGLSVNSFWSSAFQFDFITGGVPQKVTLLNQEKSISKPFMGPYFLELLWAEEGKTKKSPPFFQQYIIEMAHTDSFLSADTQVFLVPQTMKNIELKEPGEYYFRLRGVTSQQKLGDYSEVYKVHLYTPPPLLAPYILNQEEFRLAYNLRDREFFRWTQVPAAKSYRVEIYSEKKIHPIFSTTTQKLMYQWKAKTRGNYFVKVVALDRFGRADMSSTSKRFSIDKPIVHQRVLAQKNKRGKRKMAAKEQEGDKEKKRKVASESSVRKKVKKTFSQKYNSIYDRSWLQLEGASLGILNSAGRSDGDEFALAMAMAMRGVYWWKAKQGFEGVLKSKVVGYNEAGNNINPIALEAKYHYRWTVPLTWFAFLREFQVSLMSGVEYYRNSSSDNLNLLSNYSFLKSGASFHFPLWHRWATGGEILYGFGARGMTKKEIQGYVNYYIRRRWTLGLGYRVHLIDIQNTADSPDGILPYSEGYAEAFGSLRYHF